MITFKLPEQATEEAKSIIYLIFLQPVITWYKERCTDGQICEVFQELLAFPWGIWVSQDLLWGNGIYSDEKTLWDGMFFLLQESGKHL